MSNQMNQFQTSSSVSGRVGDWNFIDKDLSEGYKFRAMSKALLTAGAILLLSMPLYISAQVAGPPDEEKAKKELQVQWSKRFPSDKILNVESAGKPRLIERDSTEENALPEVRYKFLFFSLRARKKDRSQKPLSESFFNSLEAKVGSSQISVWPDPLRLPKQARNLRVKRRLTN